MPWKSEGSNPQLTFQTGQTWNFLPFSSKVNVVGRQAQTEIVGKRLIKTRMKDKPPSNLKETNRKSLNFQSSKHLND